MFSRKALDALEKLRQPKVSYEDWEITRIAKLNKLMKKRWPKGKYARSTSGHELIYDRKLKSWVLSQPITRVIHESPKRSQPLNLGIKQFKRERRGTRGGQHMIEMFKQAVWTNVYLKRQGESDVKK